MAELDGVALALWGRRKTIVFLAVFYLFVQFCEEEEEKLVYLIVRRWIKNVAETRAYGAALLPGCQTVTDISRGAEQTVSVTACDLTTR